MHLPRIFRRFSPTWVGRNRLSSNSLHQLKDNGVEDDADARILSARLLQDLRRSRDDNEDDKRVFFLQTWRTLMLFHNQTFSSSCQVHDSISAIAEGDLIPSSLTLDQLLEVIQGLALCQDFQSFSFVSRFHHQALTRRESELLNLRERLSERCLQLAFSTAGGVGVERLDRRIRLAKLWTLLDAKCDGKSVTAHIVRALGEKESLYSRRTFTKLGAESFADFCFIVGSTRSLTSQFHKYYVIFKCYDLLSRSEDFDDEESTLSFLDLGVIFEAMYKHRIVNALGHPLNRLVATRLLDKIRRSEDRGKSLRPILMYLPAILGYDVGDHERRSETIKSLLLLHPDRLDLESLVLMSPLASGLETAPEEFVSLLESRLSPTQSPRLLNAGSCQAAVHLIQSPWMSPGLRDALSRHVCDSLLRTLGAGRETAPLFLLAHSITSLAFLEILDERLLREIFSHPSIVYRREEDGALMIAKKFQYSTESKHFAMRMYLRQLAGLVDILLPGYEGPMLTKLQYPASKRVDDGCERDYTTMTAACSLVVREIARRLPQSSADDGQAAEFVCETSVLSHFLFTDFLFATMDGIDFVPISQEDVERMRTADRGMATRPDIPPGFRWFSVSLVETKTRLCRDSQTAMALFDRGYRSKGVSAFVIDYRAIAWMDKESSEALLLRFVESAFEDIRERCWDGGPGVRCFQVPKVDREEEIKIDFFEAAEAV